MKRIVPSYYQDFRCIAGACKHSCCVGWEIDVDAETLALYDGIPGEFGQRLASSIDRTGEVPCFRLTEDERCPFLNGQGLCDIISTLGEGALCQICDDHPRFYSVLSDRTEIGLGLCCEAAGRLILTFPEPVRLVTMEDDPACASLTDWERELLLLRDRAFALLQNREKTVEERARALLSLCCVRPSRRSLQEWMKIYLDLERLDDSWTAYLYTLASPSDIHIPKNCDLQIAYEQLLCYFVYRYFSGARDRAEVAVRAGFAVLSYRVIRAIAERIKASSVDDIVEIARLYSSEIEYSEENVERIFEMLNSDKESPDGGIFTHQ